MESKRAVPTFSDQEAPDQRNVYLAGDPRSHNSTKSPNRLVAPSRRFNAVSQSQARHDLCEFLQVIFAAAPNGIKENCRNNILIT